MDVVVHVQELSEFRGVLDTLLRKYEQEINRGFIAESSEKLNKIFQYYCALHQLCEFPYKKCNAPWVSTVIEPDGTVRPCFFHSAIGNIRESSLKEILNGEKGMHFRKSLDMDENETCKRCVCYLNLPAGANPIH